MGLIEEPLNVDFYFDGRQMTNEDRKRVSELIVKQKELKQRRSRSKLVVRIDAGLI
jgi:hypothetical protein